MMHLKTPFLTICFSAISLAGRGCEKSLYCDLHVDCFPCHIASNAYSNELRSGRLDLGRQNDQTCYKIVFQFVCLFIQSMAWFQSIFKNQSLSRIHGLTKCCVLSSQNKSIITSTTSCDYISQMNNHSFQKAKSKLSSHQHFLNNTVIS